MNVRPGKWVREDKPKTITLYGKKRKIYVSRWHAPYNLRKGRMNEKVLTFAEADEALETARLCRADLSAERRSRYVSYSNIRRSHSYNLRGM